MKKTRLAPPVDRADASKFTFRRPWPGPFKVIRQVGHNSYEVDLPAASYPSAHRVINVSALEPERYTAEGELATGATHSAADSSGSVTHQVGHVAQHRARRNHHEFLVRWVGGSRAHDTWERIASFQGNGSTTQALLDFELARIGDNRHVDAGTALPAVPSGPVGTTTTLTDGWVVHYAHNNDSVVTIARRLGLAVSDLLDFNISPIPGITKKSKLQPGTAVRIRSPVTAAHA